MGGKHPVQFAEDGTELKFCGKCGQYKPKTLEFFYFRASRNVWENPCRACNREYTRAYTAANPTAPENQWAASIKYRYGITEDQYWKMFADQGGVCALCGVEPGERNRNNRLSVDHNHETGQVRGLLCYNCNTAAGLLDDDPMLAAKLAQYLKGEL